MKKAIAILLMLTLILSMAACGKESNDEEDFVTEGPTVIMVTGEGGLSDQSFNDSVWSGVERAKNELKIQATCIESKTVDDYLQNILAAAEQSPNLIICAGAGMKESLIQVAPQYPDQMFLLLDNTIEGAANVAGYTFKEEEGSFLVGVAAALMSEADVIGFIGGEQSAAIERFQYGYQAGVEVINGNGENVIVNYTQNFTDAAYGKEIALAQHKAGADVIYHAAGGCGVGIIKAAGEQEFWAIGVDQDQSVLDPEHVLCSMVKRVDNATFYAIVKMINGEFDGTDVEFTLGGEGMAIGDAVGNIPEETMAEINKWAHAINTGVFIVPYDAATFKAFVTPEI